MSKRFQTKPFKLELIDLFYKDVTLNSAAITEGYHEIYSLSIPRLSAKEMKVYYYAKSDSDGSFLKQYARYAPLAIAAELDDASTIQVTPTYKLTDGAISFGYDIAVSGTAATPATEAQFTGYVYKV